MHNSAMYNYLWCHDIEICTESQHVYILSLCSSYQAQRKFASNQSPPTRPINQELASPLGLKETPKTEDFLHFLCLRGTMIV